MPPHAAAALPLLHASSSTATWWHWHLHLDVILLCLALLGAYAYAISRFRGRSDAGRLRRAQLASFAAGVFVMYLATGSPLDDVGDTYLLSAHMTQHVLLILVVAPLLLAGVPAWLWRLPLRWRGVLPVARFIVHPVVALVIVNATFVVVHLPGMLDLSLRYEEVHLLSHVALTAAGVVMWWPILSGVPELPRSSDPVQMAYLFAQSLIPSILASIVTFADSVVYPFYDHSPRLFGISPVVDQQIAGGIMKLFATTVLWAFIAIAFFRWYRREAVQDQEPIWTDAEAALRELGLMGEV